VTRVRRAVLLVGAVLAAPAAACTVLLGATDVPTPDDGGGDATTTDGGPHGDGGGGSESGDAGTDVGPRDAAKEALPSTCDAPSTRCEGTQPETCGADGVWHEAGAACTYVCLDGGCTGVCIPSSKKCSGLDPETCTAAGQWEAGAPCPFACDAGTCTGSCTPNTVQCATVAADGGGSLQGIETCDLNGQLHTVACQQPTPDCTVDGGQGACACTGTLCSGNVCAHLQTDPANCGSCGHDCLGGACASGACQPFALASQEQSPTDIAIDGVNAYWVDVAGGTVKACALDGCGGNPTVLASGQGQPISVAVSAGNLYWVNNVAPDGGAGSVMECATTGCGGAPTTLATGQAGPLAIAVNGNTVLWTGPSGTFRCSTPSCTPSSMGPAGSDVVADTVNAYWTENVGPVRCALGGCGGAPTALTGTTQVGAWAVAFDANNVYWTDTTGASVNECPLTGCTGAPILSSATFPNDVAVDSTDTYWVELTTGNVMKCAIAGCAGHPTTVASGQTNPSAIAVDATAVYWVNDGNPGTVMKLAK
jgi:hypothetical protein